METEKVATIHPTSHAGTGFVIVIPRLTLLIARIILENGEFKLNESSLYNQTLETQRHFRGIYFTHFNIKWPHVLHNYLHDT